MARMTKELEQGKFTRQVGYRRSIGHTCNRSNYVEIRFDMCRIEKEVCKRSPWGIVSSSVFC